MSPEQTELRQLAKAERAIAWQSMKRLPGRAGDAVGAFAKEHPVVTMGGAAAVALAVVARKHAAARRLQPAAATAAGGGETAPRSASWMMGLAAVAAQMLPELLKVAGLTVGAGADEPDEDEPLADKPPEGGELPHEDHDHRTPERGPAEQSGANGHWQPRTRSRAP